LAVILAQPVTTQRNTDALSVLDIQRDLNDCQWTQLWISSNKKKIFL